MIVVHYYPLFIINYPLKEKLVCKSTLLLSKSWHFARQNTPLSINHVRCTMFDVRCEVYTLHRTSNIVHRTSRLCLENDMIN
jgi:hypothetical protein